VGGLKDLLVRWKVGAVYLPGKEKDPGRWLSVLGMIPEGTRVVFLREGDMIDLGSLKFQVLGPPSELDADWDENAGSLQLLVRKGGLTALFTGDAGWEQVRRSLDRLQELDILKVPHHGSGTGFPPQEFGSSVTRLLDKNNLIAVFPSQDPGHGRLPSRKVVEWFKGNGIRTVFTGQGEGLIIRSRRQELIIKN
jgi:beta-lactamase superfamily II metal-dependent hydrolase